MAEYIEREALLCLVRPDDPSDEKAAITIATAKKLVRSLASRVPAANVAPVVHGEWVVCGDGEYVPFMCSHCGKTTSWYHKQTARYCPNCGARMDLEAEP